MFVVSATRSQHSDRPPCQGPGHTTQRPILEVMHLAADVPTLAGPPTPDNATYPAGHVAVWNAARSTLGP